MLENGADPNVKQAYKTLDRGIRNHSNAMVWAAKQDDPIYLKLLLDHGGDPNTRNANDETLLFQAFIWHNQRQNVKLLVEHGADVNAEAGMGATILASYTMRGGFEMAYWLLQHGANPAASNISDHTPSGPLIHNHVVEDIFWYPPSPLAKDWQRLCQQWLLTHGYKRPPLTDNYRDMRKDFGLPHEEKDIPLL